MLKYFPETMTINHPRLNLIGLSHPGQIIKRLNEEKANAEASDGLFARILLNCPEPSFPLWDSVEPLNEELPSIQR